MLITCICPTHGRPETLLAEAVESFLRQTFHQVRPGEAELVLVNDQPQTTYRCDAPGVRVINLPEALGLGPKHQYCVDAGRGEYICPWDDDDINLPHRLEFSFRHIEATGAQHFHTRSAWFGPRPAKWQPAENLHHGCLMAHRSLMRYTPEDRSDGDVLLFRENGITPGPPVRPEDIYYVYRWAETGQPHLSGRKPAEYRAWVAEEIAAGRKASGAIVIRPRWLDRYDDHARTAAARARRKAPRQ